MPSPFPGMDPWLEHPEVFPDLHTSLIIFLKEVINEQLPNEYYATSTKLVWVDPELRREPDVSMFGPLESTAMLFDAGPYAHEGMVAVLNEVIKEPWEQPYLEIFSSDGERLVTAIEILSPVNKKRGDSGRGAYLQKQSEFNLGGVHAVEIDLLRGGTHTTAIPLRKLQAIAPHYDYHVCVSIVSEKNQFFIKTFTMLDRLPTVVIPLDPGVDPIKVDLQPLFDRAYQSGRYQKQARYANRDCVPPLTPDQQAWAEGILREKGLYQ